MAVYNSTNWVIEYLGLLADDGNNGLKLIARYDDAMPGWQFQLNDQYYVADFDGDGRKDLYVFNGDNWAVPYVGMLRSSGAGLNVVQRYDANMPGWQMRPGDRVAAGAIVDAGQWRSFPDPLGRPELQGHHITEVPSYEVAVRVPAQELKMSALPKARITLYRWRGTGPAAPVAGRWLKAQLKGRVDTVATLKGIRMSRLSKEAQAEVRRRWSSVGAGRLLLRITEAYEPRRA